ncbi:tRNA dihydrouridine(20/20a) synthase DusA [Dichotomicrobium thermohalophilum]|uniref:tRNA-dihydrouridine(20/20a) synthase n=1 Tax=Dichotomicrobium thermohalophilum TaxID=933063 RepID=A0A397Q837_9HYPH|nr:tRNA dihydrouridine(20/20a) synthase DusA [Dichotomicrobium thermohalophilum]RIA56659.1 tRNA-U16,U17-dihydrouridine synthase [Dichotomicrobium thermohalophilum]
MIQNCDHTFAVAPMMDWTDRHFRYLMRLISRRAVLYTEMVTTGAIIHGPRARLLEFDPVEHPVVLQLGGSDPDELAECARIGADWGYDEINLNIGCPSDRVKRGRFGACLMAEPELVRDCVAAMRAAVDIPVTVKCRIGIDDQDSEAGLAHFVETVAAGGCETFIIHARKAWLHGLSPKQNRDVPPLDYDRVYRLKQARPDLNIIINGGIKDVAEAEPHLAHVDGVMLGRAICADPFVLAEVDSRLYGMTALPLDRLAIVRRMLPYIERELARGTRLSAITKHLLNLVQGLPGARSFRRHLSENAVRDGAGPEVVEDALACVEAAREAQSLRGPSAPLSHAISQ